MGAGTLRINEIFFSIQGESTRSGCPCVFIRLAGCHLRCAYCDTAYAFTQGEARSIDAIIEEVSGYGCELVAVTGGEPLLQPRVHELMGRLCDLGKTVLIETSGACDISACDARVVRVVDFKTPGSGERERNLWANVDHLRPRDEVKFVICDRADYDWAKSIIDHHRLIERCGAVLLSPVFEQAGGEEIAGSAGLAPRELAAWMLADGLAARLQLQVHKHIWDPAARGV
jgi:7-carboxy-7-deazaguanine synthase